jgi:hypothetical protein
LSFHSYLHTQQECGILACARTWSIALSR